MQILYEDNHLIAVNKPAGLLVQGDETGDKTLADFVKAYIKDRYDKPGAVFLGIVHRLDRPVSGVTLFARTSKALERMNALFAERQVTKKYLAIVERRPEPLSATLTHYILKDEERNVVKAYDQLSKRNTGAKLAELSYELVGEMGTQFLLSVNPKTGRPHQIRAQLAKVGTPIKGDLKYGFPKANADASIHLHARSIEFVHPVKNEPVRILADLPNDQLWNLFKPLIYSVDRG